VLDLVTNGDPMSVSLMLTNKSDRDRRQLIPIATQQEFVENWLPKCASLGLCFVPMFETGTVVEDGDIDFVIKELKELIAVLSRSVDSKDVRASQRAKSIIEELTKVKGKNQIEVYIG
jgi:hypothetical protein